MLMRGGACAAEPRLLGVCFAYNCAFVCPVLLLVFLLGLFLVLLFGLSETISLRIRWYNHGVRGTTGCVGFLFLFGVGCDGLVGV